MHHYIKNKKNKLLTFGFITNEGKKIYNVFETFSWHNNNRVDTNDNSTDYKFNKSIPNLIPLLIFFSLGYHISQRLTTSICLR